MTVRCDFQDSLDEEGDVLLDPNQLSEDGTVALRVYEVSHDAKYLAYGLSSSGSDWLTIQVMRVDDKTMEPDTLSWVWSKGYVYLSTNNRDTLYISLIEL